MLAPLIVVLAVLVVYVQSLGGPFLWDDRLLIVDAPLVEKGAKLVEYFQNPLWMGAGAQIRDPSYYRPLVTLSFAVDHRFHGNNPGGYHLTNVVFHLASALCLYALLRRAKVREAVAALLTSAWALQPRLAEAAAWISGRTDALSALFVLAALLAWQEKHARRALSAALFAAALFSKESAIALLPALFASEAWRARTEAGLSALGALRRAGERLLFHGLVFVAYLGVRSWAVGAPGRQADLGVIGRTLTVLQTLGTYVVAVLDPWQPRAVIGRVGAGSVPLVVTGAVAVLLAGVALARGLRRATPVTVLGLALAAGALVPVLHIVPIPLRTLAADRFLYLPTAGLVLAAAPAVDRLLGVARGRWLVASALAVSLAVVAFVRVAVWSDELEFWVRTYLETPRTNTAAAVELVNLYYRAGRYAECLTLAERALGYDDANWRDPAYDAALCSNRLGRHAEAERRLLTLRTPHGLSREVEGELALIEMQTGRAAEAKLRLAGLVRRGDARARFLATRIDELAAAQAELTRLPADADPERRARVATLIGEEQVAIAAWREVALRPGVSRASSSDALQNLVNTGDAEALEVAARAYLRRFGPIEPTLAAMIDVRLSELERLAAARPRVGLGAGDAR